VDGASIADLSFAGSSCAQSEYHYALKRFLLDTEATMIEMSPIEARGRAQAWPVHQTLSTNYPSTTTLLYLTDTGTSSLTSSSIQTPGDVSNPFSDEHIYGLAEPDYATERLDNSPSSSYCTYGPLLRPVAVGDLLDQYTENSHAPNLRYDLDTEPIGIDLRSLPARHGLVPDLVSNAIAKIELDLMQRSIYIPLDEARGRLPIFDGLYPTRTDILLN